MGPPMVRQANDARPLIPMRSRKRRRDLEYPPVTAPSQILVGHRVGATRLRSLATSPVPPMHPPRQTHLLDSRMAIQPNDTPALMRSAGPKVPTTQGISRCGSLSLDLPESIGIGHRNSIDGRGRMLSIAAKNTPRPARRSPGSASSTEGRHPSH